jgi:hypothetical protein
MELVVDVDPPIVFIHTADGNRGVENQVYWTVFRFASIQLFLGTHGHK